MYAGAPKDPDRFNLEQLDGLKLYLQKGLKAKEEGINIDLVGFGPFKRLIAYGIQC